MRQTIVGTFDGYATAEQAARHLRESGFGDSVFVIGGDLGHAGSNPKATNDPNDKDGVLARVRQFFRGLLGADGDKEARSYAEAVRRGSAFVKVEVDADADVERACRALEAAGAIDIDERAGWKPGSAKAK